MDYKAAIHEHIRICCEILLAYIKEAEPAHTDRWVPTADIKKSLGINFVAVPQANIPRGEKGWFFATLSRMLEDEGHLEYERRGRRSYCRSKKQQ